ncbi:MAG: hypothetical protein LBU76_01395 [Azoarcus sp.]|jgi:hypothetical protein|nr:hypothetical protein [Azoarcus sp.]
MARLTATSAALISRNYVLTSHFSTFHEFIFAHLLEVIDRASDEREVHQDPLGEAKSIYETQLGTLWCAVTGRKRMVGIFMNTDLVKWVVRACSTFPGVGMPETVEKDLCIVSLQPHVSNGKIRLACDQCVLLEQLKFWPEADYDDGPDALEKLWRLANQFDS